MCAGPMTRFRAGIFDTRWNRTLSKGLLLNIDWSHLLFALLLLWLPRQLLRAGVRILRGKKGRRRFVDTNPAKARAPDDISVSLRSEGAKLRNYIDFFRAALGSIALLGGVAEIEPALRTAENAGMPAGPGAFYGLLAILVVAVLIQSVRIEGRAVLYPPIFFLSGLSFGLCGPVAALFSLVLIWTVNLALPNPTAFLSIYALLLVLFGVWFRGVATPWTLVAGGLTFMPVLASLLFRRRLVMFSKKTKVSGHGMAT